jgi:hypothetical protein
MHDSGDDCSEPLSLTLRLTVTVTATEAGMWQLTEAQRATVTVGRHRPRRSPPRRRRIIGPARRTQSDLDDSEVALAGSMIITGSAAVTVTVTPSGPVGAPALQPAPAPARARLGEGLGAGAPGHGHRVPP